MLDVGMQVRLLAEIGGYPVGTIGTLVAVRSDDCCEVEFETGRRLLIDSDALGTVVD
jgi:hypothetical protein